MTKTPPNKPDAVNPAIAPRFAVVHHWRGVTDPERWVSSARMNTSAMSIAGAAMVLLALLGCSTTPKENYGQAYETSLTQAEVMMQILRTLDSGDIAKTRHMAMIVVHVDLSSLSDYLPKENRSAEQQQEEMMLAREVLDYMLRHREEFNPRLLSLRMGMRALRDILTDEEDVQRLTELSDYFAGVEARLPSNP